MEISKVEVTVVEQTTNEADEVQMLELNKLQLAFVGGGGGDVVFA